MHKNIDRYSAEELVQGLIQGEVDVNELDLAKFSHRDALQKALETRPAILGRVSPTVEGHFFKFAIEKNYEYFVQLERSQYTDELAQIYIFNRLTSTNYDDKPTNPDMYVQRSMDEKTVINFFYTSTEGDELYYMDKELQVPLSLRSSIQLTLKLTNAVMLIDKLDTHVTQLGERKIKAVLTDIITNQYKNYLNEFIQKKNIGYYTLCTSLNEIESGFKSKLTTLLASYGFSVSNFVIKKIAIPKDIQHKIEDQAFKIRQRRADVEADSEFAKLSLESYEAKLAIQAKYPDAEFSLTEYEKDLALKRYLTKNGITTEEEVDRSIRLNNKVVGKDSEISKEADIIPEIEPKPNSFKIVFFFVLALSLFITFIIMFNAPGAGFIILALIALIFGGIAAANYEKLKRNPVESDKTDNESDMFIHKS